MGRGKILCGPGRRRGQSRRTRCDGRRNHPPAPAAVSETKPPAPPAPAAEAKPPASPAPAAPSAARTGIECIDRWEDFIDLTKAPAPWLTWGADLRFRAEYANNNSTLNGDIAGHETSQQKYRPRW